MARRAERRPGRVICKCRGPSILLLALLVAGASGQGLLRDDGSALGATSASSIQLAEAYAAAGKQWKAARAWQQAVKQSKGKACSGSSLESLCSSSVAEDAEKFGALMFATSPPVFSSVDPRDVPFRVLSAPRTQGTCSTCTAQVVATVAEAAVASALGRDVGDVGRISAQSLYFCSDDPRDCTYGASLRSTLLELRRRPPPLEECLPYKPPDVRSLAAPDQLCAASCDDTLPEKGTFSFAAMSQLWQVQQQIRLWGAVATRFTVYSDFKPFFSKYSNVNKVYRPGPGVTVDSRHAVALIGYNNEERWWLARNSWGSDWGDQGNFKVAFETCDMLSPGDTFGVTFALQGKLPTLPPLPLSPAPGLPPGCAHYKAGPRDYASTVADRTGMPLEQLLLKNLIILEDDPGAPLDGKTLIVCPGGSAASNAAAAAAAAKAGTAAAAAAAAAATTAAKAAAATQASPVQPPAASSTSLAQQAAAAAAAAAVKAAAAAASPTPPSPAQPQAASGASQAQQLASLLAIRSALDASGNALPSWTRTAGTGGAFCGGFQGVSCDAGGNIENITLADVSLRGTLPPGSAMRGLPNLKVFNLLRCGIVGTAPADWAQEAVPRLEDLRVVVATHRTDGSLIPDAGGLSGPLPAEWRYLTRLRFLDLSFNKLEGTLHRDMGTGWGWMRYLYLQGNGLEGTMPVAFYGMSLLKSLDFSFNNLGGPLPDGAWPELEYLLLPSNAFTGTIPSRWGEMRKLKVLDLQKNQLVGTVPASFGGAWPDGRPTVFLNKNAGLTGCMPPGFIEGSEWNKFYTCGGTGLTCKSC